MQQQPALAHAAIPAGTPGTPNGAHTQGKGSAVAAQPAGTPAAGASTKKRSRSRKPAAVAETQRSQPPSAELPVSAIKMESVSLEDAEALPRPLLAQPLQDGPAFPGSNGHVASDVKFEVSEETVVAPATPPKPRGRGARTKPAAPRIRRDAGPAAATAAEAVVAEAAAVVAAPPAKPARKPRQRKKPADTAAPSAGEGNSVAVAVAEAALATPVRAAKPVRRRAAKVEEDESARHEAVVDMVATQEPLPKGRSRKRAVAVVESADLEVEGEPGKRRNRRRKTKEVVEAVETEEGGEGDDEKVIVKTTKRGKAAKENLKPVFEIPGRDMLARALAAPPGPRPVPNLGYACLNMELREQKPPIWSSRDCIQKTWLEKGLPYISQLVLENARSLPGLIQWNQEHGIRFFRLSSCIVPWMSEYQMEELPDFEAISEELAFAGQLARAYDQRLTFHPSHFVKIGTADEDLLAKSLKELEMHAKVFDLMGFEPSHWNKINIHIGGNYGDKETTLERFGTNFLTRCSPAVKARLTVENDDRPNDFSVADLLPLHKRTGIPLVFDFHHHKFCAGGMTEREAFLAAVGTWPAGVRPVVHWSESQEGRKPHAHSDYIQGPMNFYGLEDKIDVMIEAKAKEQALLRFRGTMAAGPNPHLQMAMKFL